ncbi:MAG: N-acetylmuramoyl-L-alanine amidase [Proteobacteria bacterium]|nr:N-acetylmuramoyl-L-alanine amidase [Pseudomonadota bacterium]
MKRLAALCSFAAIVLGPVAVHADPSVAAYEKAKPCYARLTSPDVSAAPEREWRACISAFEEIYRSYPTGGRTPAALFSAAKLKGALYSDKRGRADLEGAIKDLNLLVREFPKSPLADDALYLIGVMRRDDLKQPDRAQRAFTFIIENYPDGDMVSQARVALESGGVKAAEASPASAKAGKSRYQAAGPGAMDSAEVFAIEMAGAPADAAEAPASPAAPAAGASRERAPPPAAPRAAATAKATAFDRAALEAVRVTESKGQTLVELILDKDVEYAVEYTERGPRTRSPAVLDLSVFHAYAAPAVEKKSDVGTRELVSYRIGKMLLSSGIKASFVMAPDTRYDIKNRGGVISVSFTSASASSPAAAPAAGPGGDREGAAPSGGPSAIRIVVDPGHGGDDQGAVGPGGTLEKDVTLALSRKIAAALRKEIGARVWLTRDSDRSMTLEERHAFAIRKRADIFISVHANASTHSSASGVETYYLDNATDEAARKLADRENSSAGKKLSQVEHILSTMLQNYDAALSADLARDVQSRLAGRFATVKDRGVRSAMFYVLVGAKCPAILVEAAFISNPREEKLLASEKYQGRLAEALAAGVSEYLRRREDRLVSL